MNVPCSTLSFFMLSVFVHVTDSRHCGGGNGLRGEMSDVVDLKLLLLKWCHTFVDGVVQCVCVCVKGEQCNRVHCSVCTSVCQRQQ